MATIRNHPKAAVLIAGALVASFLLGGLIFSGGDEAKDSAKGPSDDHTSEDHTNHEHEADQYTCSMHPQVRAQEPGACPICGMDLIPVENASADTDQAPNRISLSESAKIRARIRTTKVKTLGGEGGLERRLLGRVDYDETRQRRVTSWISGRIDKLRIRSTGQRVKRGQVIATLYSPEVFSAHQDLLVAKKQALELAKASPIARSGAEAALVASRDRLRLLGVPVSEIASMEKATRPSEQVRIRSPFSGTVIKRLATEGSYVRTGSALYEIADLSKVWIQLDAYESDLPILSVGQSVSLKVEALPGESFEGKVTFVDPVLDARTRTTRVRIAVNNRDRRLRPGMFAEAVVRSDGTEPGTTLVVPDTAPLFTGRRSLVYVEIPGQASPTYEARVVKLGPKMGDVYPVVAGLRAGEEVVVHGAFTIDADLQIRGGLSMMSSLDDTEAGAFDGIVEVPAAQREALASIVNEYLNAQKALSDDKLELAKTKLEALGKAAKDLDPKSPAAFRSAWQPIQTKLVTHTTHAPQASALSDARVMFRDLSLAIEDLLRTFGNPTNAAVHHAFCPMAFDGVGATWLQRADAIENPYFGESMYTCGTVKAMVVAGSHLANPASETPRRAAPAGEHQH